MKPDFYTKVVLTVIALMLTVIACKPLVSPDISASAQGPFAGVQFTSEQGAFVFFDAKTGNIWDYPAYNGYKQRSSGGLRLLVSRSRSHRQRSSIEPRNSAFYANCSR